MRRFAIPFWGRARRQSTVRHPAHSACCTQSARQASPRSPSHPCVCRRRIGPHRIAPPTPDRVASLKSPRHGRFRSYSSRLNGMRVIGRCRKRSLFSLATLEMGWRPGRISTLRHSQQPHRLLLPPTRCLDGSFSEFPWVSTHDSLRVPGLGPRSGHTRCELIAHSSPFAACGCSYSLLGWGSRNAALFSYASTKRVFRGTDTGTLSKHRA